MEESKKISSPKQAARRSSESPGVPRSSSFSKSEEKSSLPPPSPRVLRPEAKSPVPQEEPLPPPSPRVSRPNSKSTAITPDEVSPVRKTVHSVAVKKNKPLPQPKAKSRTETTPPPPSSPSEEDSRSRPVSGMKAVLDSSLVLFSWGTGEHGQLAQAKAAVIEAPRIVAHTKKLRIEKLAAGNTAAAGLTIKGELFMWGSGALGQSSDVMQISFPYLVPFYAKDQRIVQVFCGQAHSLILTDMGKLHGWGDPELSGHYNSEHWIREPTLIEDLAHETIQFACVSSGFSFLMLQTLER